MPQDTIVQEGLAVLREAAEKLTSLLNCEPETRAICANSEASLPFESRVSPTESMSEQLHVYIAGCQGCGRLARRWGPQLMRRLGLQGDGYISKIGTTTKPVPDRLQQIGRDQFGGAIRQHDRLVMEEGFSAWIAHQIIAGRRPNDPAIRLHPRTIAVDLPSGMSRRGFDVMLHRALRSRSLADIRPPDMPERLVAYEMGGATRLSTATELYVLSPHKISDVDLLLAKIEGIVRSATKRHP